MSIRAGQILHAANRRGFVIDRIQTGGPGDLNIPTEKINELGNFRSVATVRDAPDLSFSLDMLNVGCEVERGLTNKAEDFLGPFEFDQAVPLDVISPWKNSNTSFKALHGVAIPNLYLESVSYAFGLDDNAGQTFTLAGDSIFYTPGTPAIMEVDGDGAETDFAFEAALADGGTPEPVTALEYVESGISQYALSVSVDGERLIPDSGTVASPNGDGDYTSDPDGVYFAEAPASGAAIRVVFAHAEESDWEAVHEGVSVKPAAIKGRDIIVRIGGQRWSDVQSVSLDWSVTLEEDMEFGNPRAVARDFSDVPEVTGSIEIKPRSIESLFTKLREITGVGAGQVIGPSSDVMVTLEIELRNPDSGGTTAHPSGEVLKTFYVPDARFTLPGYEGAVETKMTNTMNFESDEGVLQVFEGARPDEVPDPDPEP